MRSPHSGVYTGHTTPIGDVGDLWACDTCGTVWIMREPPPPNYSHGHSPRGREWARAPWRLQRKYGPKYTCGCRVGGKVKCGRGPDNGTIHGVHPPWVSTTSAV